MKNLIIKSLIIVFIIMNTSCKKEEVIYSTAAKAQFAVSATTIEQEESVIFTDQSVAAQGSKVVSWNWSFGDEEESVSAEQNPTHTYNKIGTFTATLEVTCDNGMVSRMTQNIIVTVRYDAVPHAKFAIVPGTYLVNNPIEFKDLSEASRESSITAWSWNFGENDKSVSNEQHPNYSYTSSGSFTISLTVTDSKNLQSTYTQDILVLDPADLVSISWKKPLLGAIENTVSPAMSPDGKVVYAWADQSAPNAYDVKLKAYNAQTGDENWAFDVNGAFASLNPNAGVRLVYSSPAVGPNGDVYIAARDLKNSGAARKSFMLAVKADGTLRWSYAFGIDANFNYITPAIDASGNIYISHLTNKPFEIAVIDPTNGAKIKSIPLDLGARSGMSVNKSGDIFFCSTGNNGLFSYGQNGTMKFQYNEGYATTGGDITIDAQGNIYTVANGSNGGIVSAISNTGATKWSYSNPGENPYGGVVIDSEGTIIASGGTAIIGTESAGVVALNKDGSFKWRYATEENVGNCVPLIDNRNYVHFITDNGTYYVITNTGTLYGKKSLGTGSYSSPVMDASGNVFITVQEDSISYIYKLETGATGVSDSDWPMKGQNMQRTHFQK